MAKYTTEYSLPIERIMAYATCLHHNPYLGKQSVFTLILPLALYSSETWKVTNKIALNTFERKILRKIYGPIQENGIWRKRCNHELYNFIMTLKFPQKKSQHFQNEVGRTCAQNG
jgi:hypothetical protein